MEELLKQIGEAVKELKTNVDDMNAKSASQEEVKSLQANLEALELKMKSPTFNQNEEKSTYFEGQKAARLWKLQILSSQEKKSLETVANEVYGKDAKFVEEIKALSAGGNAGQLIETQYYAEILPLLYNKLIISKLGSKRVPMPNGNITIRKMVSGSTAAYVGESKSTKASGARFASLKLSGKKLTVKVPFSNDLLRSASPAADMMVRDDMIMQLQIAMDYNAIYGLGTEYTPQGIANAPGVNKVTKSELLDGDKLYTDLVTPLKKANIPMTNLGWAFNPDVFSILYNEVSATGNYKYRDELKTGKFHGYPFSETNQIVTGTDAKGKVDIIFGDFDQFVIGEQLALEIKTSEDATYLDENGETQSAFDNDETVVKALVIHDFGVAYGQAFSVGNYQTIAQEV